MKNQVEMINGWSRSTFSESHVYYPECINDLKIILNSAKRKKLNIIPMGSGHSYGDEFQNSDNVVIKTEYLNKIISWNSITGMLTVEPGVTIKQILSFCLVYKTTKIYINK